MQTYQYPASYQPNIPVHLTIDQLAEGILHLSKSELETLDILLDKKAVRAIEQSRKEADSGKLRELKTT